MYVKPTLIGDTSTASTSSQNIRKLSVHVVFVRLVIEFMFAILAENYGFLEVNQVGHP
jgi:hypothetical protein